MGAKGKLTTNAGTLVVNNQDVLTAGPRGLRLLQEVWLLENSPASTVR